MQSKVNYTAVGIFVVVLGVFLCVAVLWLGAFGDSKKFNTYLVYVHEDVTGLSAESVVRFNGVEVGYVRSIRLDADNPKLVKLKLSIQPDVKITTSTYAILNAQGITGVVYVNLKAQTETAPPLVAAPGEEFPVIPSHPSLLMQLSEVLPEVATNVKNLSASISQVLDVDNRQSIKESLQNLSLTTKTLSNQILPNAQQAFLNLSKATANLNDLTDELQRNPSILVRGKQPAVLGPGEK